MIQHAMTEFESGTDFTLPEGCLLCGGDLEMRITASGGAHSFCGHCHWLSHPSVQLGKDGLTVSYSSAGQA